MVSTTQVKPGAYFYTSWGYDQTNIDFIVVVKVSPTGKTAQCRRASKIDAGGGQGQDAIMAGTAYGEPFTMKVRDDGVLRGSYPYCEGGKRLDTFWPLKLGEVKHETNSYFGH